MNAPTTKAAVHPRKSYEPIVRMLLPDCSGRALATRCQLMLMRDAASLQTRLRDRSITDLERFVAERIEHFVQKFVLADIEDQELAFVHERVVRMSRFLRSMDCQEARNSWDALQREIRMLEALAA